MGKSQLSNIVVVALVTSLGWAAHSIVVSSRWKTVLAGELSARGRRAEDAGVPCERLEHAEALTTRTEEDISRLFGEDEQP